MSFKRAHFFAKRGFGNVICPLCNEARENLVQAGVNNHDSEETEGRFRQHFTSCFSVWMCYGKVYCTYKFCVCRFSVEGNRQKSVPKKLLKLTMGWKCKKRAKFGVKV